MRWRHPQQGLIPPEQFLGTAREAGLIVPLGEWVLRTACWQAQTWLVQGVDVGRMAVNVNGAQIMRSDFVATVARVLAETGLPANRLELEITENFLLENAGKGMDTVAQFSHMGVSVAIDDFGTGYSSLAYLKYLHADSLKIDKSFVSDLPHDSDGAAIVQAVCSLGRGLGFLLVAEGVETTAQLAHLAKAGCDVVQGYYFARPMPAAELEKWLASAPLDDRLARA